MNPIIHYDKIKFVVSKDSKIYTDYSLISFNILNEENQLTKSNSKEKLNKSNSKEKLNKSNSKEKLIKDEKQLTKTNSKEKLTKSNSNEKLINEEKQIYINEKAISPLKKNVLIQKVNSFTLSDNIENDVVAKNIIFNYLRDTDVFREFMLNKSIYFKGTETIESIFNLQSTNLSLESFKSDKTDKLKFSFKAELGVYGKVGTPYVFECNNNELIFKRSENILIKSEKFNNDIEKFACLKNNKTLNKKSCLNYNFPTTFIANSEYVNESIIGFFLNKIFFPDLMSYDNKNLDSLCLGKILNNENLGLSVFQLGYFQTIEEDNLVGYNVMEKADNKLDKLFNTEKEFNKIKIKNNKDKDNKDKDNKDKDNKDKNNKDKDNKDKDNKDKDNKIRHILLQIITALKLLTEEYDFFHGDLKAGNIFYKFDDDYLNYEINGEYSNIRIKVADYGKSSISYDNKRYFCRESNLQFAVDTYVSVSDINLNMENSIKTESIKINNKKYSIHTFDYQIDDLFQIRHIGCPTFNSIDFYILIISLCLQCSLFQQYCIDKEIIKYLFLDKVETITSKKKNLTSVVTANSFLKGKKIICEVFDIILLLL